MLKSKKFLTAAALAGLFGLGLFATSSFANGPIVLGPTSTTISVPKMLVTPTASVSFQTKALAAYKHLRLFWLARGIVR